MDRGNGVVLEKESKKELQKMFNEMLLFPEAKTLEMVSITAVGVLRH